MALGYRNPRENVTQIAAQPLSGEGFAWDDNEKPLGNSTVNAENLPETIEKTTEDILKEAIKCIECGRAYNIAKGELELLRKLGLPLPHSCPKCRENGRFNRMTLPKLYDRECDKCRTKVRSPYDKGRPEIIYCEKCYQQEVY